ncbi:hypothetical protein V2J09_016723 [Rumex salicifolius]
MTNPTNTNQTNPTNTQTTTSANNQEETATNRASQPDFITDPNHQLFLHHSDHPNYSLATQLLDDTNYHQWRRSVEVSLTAKNKWSLVTGKYQQPDAGSPLEMQWRRCNSMVIAWLLHSVDKEIAETLLYYDTAADIWADLKQRFGQPSLARTYQVQKELFNISQGTVSVSSYYTKFKRIWDEYFVLAELPKCGSCGILGPIPQMIANQQVLQFLVGLNESYNALRANVLMMKPTPKIGEVYQLVLQEEKQRLLLSNVSQVGTDSSAFHAYSKQGQSSNSYHNGGQNFNPKSNWKHGNSAQSNNTGNTTKGKPSYFCDHCKIPGHSISRCFKIHGYPKDFKEKRFAGNTTVDEHKSNTEPSPSFTSSQYERILAIIANIGTIRLTSSITLHHVLHVPEFSYNLLSVGCLVRSLQANLLFTPTQCILQGLSVNTPQVLGNFSRGLYLTSTTGQPHLNSVLSFPSCNNIPDDACFSVTPELMHLRLGHVPFESLSRFSFAKEMKQVKTDFVCTICPKARQHRASFPISDIKTVQPFQMLHIDIWGPYKVKTYNGYSYFLSIVDDYTRSTWVHLLAHKNAALSVLKTFITFIENQYHKTVQTIRSDNGGEFCSFEANQFFTTKGIFHQLTCVDTPQQNGVVERKHKHLLETARALLFQSHLPDSYWGECVLTATYLINRFPLISLNHITPYEKLHGQPPTYNHLRPFGCLCFVATLKS